MANIEAINHASASAKNAKEARIALIGIEGAVEKDGSGGRGLQLLADAVEKLARAVVEIARV